MDRIIRHISGKFVEKLPKMKDYFAPDDLYKSEIPRFLAERVFLEMQQHLSESISIPESDWADLSDSGVQSAWENFLDEVSGRVRMPVSVAKSIFDTAVSDTLDLATQPREAIPEVIFGTQKTLTIAQIKRRSRFVTVNKHLAKGLVRYMERKNKETLSAAECSFIIEKIDEKLTRNYNPLNWAQVLEPLFLLAGPEVDTNLFRIFFEDKGLNRIARKFDMLNTSLKRAQFIEVLSSPELLDFEGYEEDHPSLFEVNNDRASEEKQDVTSKLGIAEDTLSKIRATLFEPKIEDEPDDSDEEFYHSKSDSENEKVQNESDKRKSMSEEEAEIEDSILNAFHKRRYQEELEQRRREELAEMNENYSEEDEAVDEVKEGEEEDEAVDEVKESEEGPLHRRFVFDIEAAADEHEDEDADPKTLYEELRLKKESASKNEDGFSLRDFHDPSKNRDLDEEDLDELAEVEAPEKPKNYIVEPADEEDWEYPDYDDEEEDDAPIWRSFLEREDLSKYAESGDKESGETDDAGSVENKKENEFLDEPIFDLTKKEPSVQEQIGEISEWLKGDEQRFINEIFGGSDEAYEQALADIHSIDEWKSATNYIEKEIFSRNLIDVYDEVAVDFTDRLHTFFREKNNA